MFFSAHTGKMSVFQFAWYLLLSCAAAVRSAEPHTVSSLLSDGKFLMAQCIPVSL